MPEEKFLREFFDLREEARLLKSTVTLHTDALRDLTEQMKELQDVRSQIKGGMKVSHLIVAVLSAAAGGILREIFAHLFASHS